MTARQELRHFSHLTDDTAMISVQLLPLPDRRRWRQQAVDVAPPRVMQQEMDRLGPGGDFLGEADRQEVDGQNLGPAVETEFVA
jgi:hypothetical protein